MLQFIYDHTSRTCVDGVVHRPTMTYFMLAVWPSTRSFRGLVDRFPAPLMEAWCRLFHAKNPSCKHYQTMCAFFPDQDDLTLHTAQQTVQDWFNTLIPSFARWNAHVTLHPEE
jgi:hypothetical protein